MVPDITNFLTFLQNNSITIFLGAITFIFVYNVFRHRGKLPPSPVRFPLVGNLFMVGLSLLRGEELEEIVTRLSQKYGNVFCIYIGTSRVVFLNDLKTITEAFKNPALTDRIPNHTVKRLTGGDGEFLALYISFSN